MDEAKRLWRKRLGNVGEAIVMRYLTQCGWRLLRSKFHVGRSSEIDLVMSNPDGVTVFIEVKTRTLSRRGDQQDWHESVSHTINWRKQRKILSAARAYKIETADHGSECRFDLIMLGLSSDLAAMLVHKSANSELHSSESIDLEASKLTVDKTSCRARLIHCENVFVTNF